MILTNDTSEMEPLVKADDMILQETADRMATIEASAAVAAMASSSVSASTHVTASASPAATN
jgi:hypothetical protein